MKSYQAPFLVVAVFLFAGIVWADSDGIFEGLTGAPGETTCADCHFNLNTGIGGLGINSPSEYNLGDTIDVMLWISHVGQSRWGFEFTALDASDQPAGEAVLLDPVRTQVIVGASGREYVSQTTAGSDQGQMSFTQWFFRWATPETDVGAVTFYVSAVAGNEGGGANGDYTYTDTYSLMATHAPDVPSDDLPKSFSLAQNYPNPFNLSTVIGFDLPARSAVKLTIYNLLGQKVRTLVDEERPAGSHAVVWDGTDQSGQVVASGAYFYRLAADGLSDMRTMVLLK